jgi:predicted chitinase
MSYTERTYIQNANGCVRNQDLLNIRMTSDWCEFTPPVVEMTGTSKIQSVSATSEGVYLITGQTGMTIGLIFSGGPAEYSGSSVDTIIEVYPYDTVISGFTNPYIYKASAISLSGDVVSSAYTVNLPVSDVYPDNEYLIKTYFEFDACTEFLNILGVRYDNGVLLGDEYSEGAFGGLSEEQIIEQDEEVKEKVKAEQQFTDVSITGNWDTKQQSVIDGLLSACDAQGIDNEFVKIAVLSVSGKETNFRPRAEIGYGGTPNSRLVEIWPYLKKISNSDLTKLKKNDVAFFDNTYGGKYGNSEYKDGYKFRGRGPNQLTFKDNYKNITKVSGIDFTTNPDWLNDPIKGGVAGVTYLVDRMKTVPSDLAQYKDLNTVPNLETAILIVFRANAGWGKDISDSLHQQTLQKCRNISKYFS